MKKNIIEEIVASKRLCTIYHENEAAKFLISFLKEHQEYSENDVNLKLIEDGHTSSYRNNKQFKPVYAVIYKTREETDDEFNRRMDKIENTILERYKACFQQSIYNMDDTMLHSLPNDMKQSILNKFIDESKILIEKQFNDLSVSLNTENKLEKQFNEQSVLLDTENKLDKNDLGHIELCKNTSFDLFNA